MSALRRFTAGALLLLLTTFGLSQQTVIITGPRELTGPLTIRVIPPAPAPPPSAPVITTPTPLPDGDINEPYSINLAATGGTLLYSWYLAATETLPQDMEAWTPASGDLAFQETFGDPGCSATDNVWPTPGGLVIDNSAKLTGNCSGQIPAGTDTAVMEEGLGLTRTWLSQEHRFTTLPATTVTTLLFIRSATGTNVCRTQYDPATGFIRILNAGGTTQNVFQPANDTRYKIELYAERGVIAANAKCHARVATHNGTTYNAPGAWVESNDGTWTELIDNIRPVFNHNSGEWFIDTIERCQFGPVSEGFCGGSAPDLYTTPSPVPNNVHVDGTVPISESLWSHDGTDLQLEIATDPDLSTIEVAEKPGGVLTLSQAGVLSGTPTADGTLSFTARVCDAVGSCATKAFSLDINEAPGTPPPGPWVHSATPTRTHYVDDIACGGVGTIGDPECPGTAFSSSHYQCGDLHILRAGNYLPTFTNYTGFSRDCTSGAPAVFKGYVNPTTGQPENAQFRGEISFPGAWNWFVNMHCDNEKDQTSGIGCWRMKDPGNHLINSVAHDTQSSVVRWFADGGVATPNMVIYGTVKYGAGEGTNGSHNVYAHNNVEISGRRYYVHNINLRPDETRGGRRFFQGNDSSGDNGVQGFWLEGNFFGDAVPTNGQTLVWTMSPGVAFPNRDVNLIDNYFVDFYGSSSQIESIRFGAGIPLQGTVIGNYFARANMSFNGWWGASGTHDQMVFTGNEIYDPPNGEHIRLVTRGTGSSDYGVPKFGDADEFDNNTYGGTFKAADLQCNNQDFTNLTLTQWRTNTNNCRVTPGGAGFDLNSTVVANPTTDKVRVIQNQYQCPTCVFTDGDWGFIHCVNWDGNSTCNADISTVVGPGKQYVVRYPRDFFGTAAASGTCPGAGACPVTLPTRRTSGEAAGEFTNAYVITGEP